MFKIKQSAIEHSIENRCQVTNTNIYSGGLSISKNVQKKSFAFELYNPIKSIESYDLHNIKPPFICIFNFNLSFEIFKY